MKHGLFFGKFAPLSTGHISAINIASTKVDVLHVVLCWDEKFQNSLPSEFLKKALSKINRHKWLLDTFKHKSNIVIHVVDETPIPSYPYGEAEFTKLVTDVLSTDSGINKNDIDFVFSSETDYCKYFDAHWSKAQHILIDPNRSTVNISATRIRNNVSENWNYLAPAAKPDFVRKVVIVGVESSGKSTLTIDLANHFSTVYVEEVGRTICENEYHSSEKFMRPEDYVYIAMKHKAKEKEYTKIANKVLFSDTNNLITLFSAECMGWESEVLEVMSRNEEYDLVILLDNNVPWVYDPLRTNSTPEQRSNTFDKLVSMLRKQGTDYHFVTGDFTERYNTAVQLVNELLNNN